MIHDDTDKWKFMLRKLTHAARHRALSGAEVVLVNVLKNLLSSTDGKFAQSQIGGHIAMLCSCCTDPLWTSKEP
jgi:hypothetical protein